MCNVGQESIRSTVLPKGRRQESRAKVQARQRKGDPCPGPLQSQGGGPSVQCPGWPSWSRHHLMALRCQGEGVSPAHSGNSVLGMYRWACAWHLGNTIQWSQLSYSSTGTPLPWTFMSKMGLHILNGPNCPPFQGCHEYTSITHVYVMLLQMIGRKYSCSSSFFRTLMPKLCQCFFPYR